jgi:hypothetical protein
LLWARTTTERQKISSSAKLFEQNRHRIYARVLAGASTSSHSPLSLIGLKNSLFALQNSLFGRVGNSASNTLKRQGKFDQEIAKRSDFAEIPC